MLPKYFQYGINYNELRNLVFLNIESAENLRLRINNTCNNLPAKSLFMYRELLIMFLVYIIVHNVLLLYITNKIIILKQCEQ